MLLALSFHRVTRPAIVIARRSQFRQRSLRYVCIVPFRFSLSLFLSLSFYPRYGDRLVRSFASEFSFHPPLTVSYQNAQPLVCHKCSHPSHVDKCPNQRRRRPSESMMLSIAMFFSVTRPLWILNVSRSLERARASLSVRRDVSSSSFFSRDLILTTLYIFLEIVSSTLCPVKNHGIRNGRS